MINLCYPIIIIGEKKIEKREFPRSKIILNVGKNKLEAILLFVRRIFFPTIRFFLSLRASESVASEPRKALSVYTRGEFLFRSARICRSAVQSLLDSSRPGRENRFAWNSLDFEIISSNIDNHRHRKQSTIF